MANLTIYAINNDAAYLYTFTSPDARQPAYRILIDPWLNSPATLLSQWVSRIELRTPAVFSSLTDMDPPPDLILLSMHSPDHANHGTLTTLPRDTGVRIVAAPDAAPVVAGWKHFAKSPEVLALWTLDGARDVLTIPIAAKEQGGTDGAITVAFLKEQSDVSDIRHTTAVTFTAPTGPSFTSTSRPRPLSFLFSPHGIDAPLAAAWMAEVNRGEHLTALLHPFNGVVGPWYFGWMLVIKGADSGARVAELLRPDYWLQVHDEDKVTSGVFTKGMASTYHTLEGVRARLAGEEEAGEKPEVGVAVAVSERHEEKSQATKLKTKVIKMRAGQTWSNRDAAV